MEALRFQVVGEAFKKKPLDVKAPSERPYEYFGKKVFNREKMYKYLRKDVYEKMIDVIDNGARLDRAVADAVAAGIVEAAKIISDDGKSLPVPVVVRLEGTNVEQGRKILQDSPIANVIMAPTMEGGAEEIVKRVKAAQ